jgi:hypothetical protein
VQLLVLATQQTRAVVLWQLLVLATQQAGALLLCSYLFLLLAVVLSSFCFCYLSGWCEEQGVLV